MRALLLIMALVSAAPRAADAGPFVIAVSRDSNRHLNANERMGAWGPGSFENDDAMDWLADLVDGGGMDVVESAFHGVADAEYLEAPEASSAVAAAEVVAALAGRPPAELPDEAAEWVAAHGRPPADRLMRQARAAVRRVRTDSELKELWEEGEEADAWYACIDDLLRRLD